jgi:hypothetical protein
MTKESLKVRAYDLLAALEQIQRELNQVNQNIANYKEEVPIDDVLKD